MKPPSLAARAMAKRDIKKSKKSRSHPCLAAHGACIHAQAYLYSRLALWETWERKAQEACDGKKVVTDNRKRKLDCDNCWDSDCDGCESESSESDSGSDSDSGSESGSESDDSGSDMSDDETDSDSD